ncbi:hypothetical protein DFR46_1376 [Parasphingopyxis lamellibrachiae]|uniref:YD repeat-containing protein n=2 Tax=Parasphingopyxis lamellibrachiae TaxID=680125 RepID=A0A3D9FEV6_9SPHN|nr:hypothetical protein DFR46_1376 [Parasphingopyxis lamellibrachiae]
MNGAGEATAQWGLRLAGAAMLAMWAWPAQTQVPQAVAADMVAKQDNTASKSPPPELRRDFSFNGVTQEDATVFRYDGGIFRESSDGWTETRDSGEVFTYDLVTGRPGGNALSFHDADRNVRASISFSNGAIFIRAADGSLIRSHQVTAAEAVPRSYPRPHRPSMYDLQTANFEGGQLRRSLYGQWIRRDDDGHCSIYRSWSAGMIDFSIWDEENDIVLTIYLDTMGMQAERLNAGVRSPIDGYRLTEVSRERDFDPMRDCNDRPAPIPSPATDSGSGNFPLETIQTRIGVFSRISDDQWSYFAVHGDLERATETLPYDVMESSDSHLLAYNEANEVYALIELDNRSLSVFSLNGVVDQFYPITETTPEFAWETASQRRDMTATEMTTIDYEGGQFRRLGAGSWIDMSDENGCSYYDEWDRDLGNVTMIFTRRRRSSSPRISINIAGMTATVHSGYAAGSPVVETRQLTATGNEDLGYNPSDVCYAN